MYIPRLSYGDEPLHTHSLLHLQARLLALGVAHSFAAPFWDSHINRGRNRAIANFRRREDCTHVLWLDADMVFQPWDVERLIAEARVGADFVGAPYPMKRMGGEHVVGTFVEPRVRTESGFYEAIDVGAGFSLLSRGVFARLDAAAPRAVSDIIGDANAGETYGVYYDSGVDPVTRQYLSEDWWISRAWRDCGGRAWLDGDARLGHVGKHIYQAASSVHEAVLREDKKERT